MFENTLGLIAFLIYTLLLYFYLQIYVLFSENDSSHGTLDSNNEDELEDLKDDSSDVADEDVNFDVCNQNREQIEKEENFGNKVSKIKSDISSNECELKENEKDNLEYTTNTLVQQKLWVGFKGKFI